MTETEAHILQKYTKNDDDNEDIHRYIKNRNYV